MAKPEKSIDYESDRLDQIIAQNKLEQEVMLEQQAPLNNLYTWDAPERLYSPKSRTWYVIVAVIAMLFIVYSALTMNFVLIFLIISLVLVIYSLNTIPPQKTTYRITNKGLSAFDTLYLWRNMLYFWVTLRGSEYLINIEYKEKTTDLYYQRMIILAGDGKLKEIVGNLVRHVDYLSANQTSVLKSFLEGKYIPLLSIIKFEDMEKVVEEKGKK